MSNFIKLLRNKLIMYVSVNKQTTSFQTCRCFASRLFHGKSDAICSHFKYVQEVAGQL